MANIPLLALYPSYLRCFKKYLNIIPKYWLLYNGVMMYRHYIVEYVLHDIKQNYGLVYKCL